MANKVLGCCPRKGRARPKVARPFVTVIRTGYLRGVATCDACGHTQPYEWPVQYEGDCLQCIECGAFAVFPTVIHGHFRPTDNACTAKHAIDDTMDQLNDVRVSLLQRSTHREEA